MVSVLLFYAVALLMRGLPCVGKPMLACTRDGIETAAYGPVPWQDIQGMVLTRVTLRGRDFHTLELLVPKLSQLTAQMHPCARLGYALRWGDRRQRLRFPLAFAGERLQKIEDDYARSVAEAERELKGMHPEALRLLKSVEQLRPPSGPRSTGAHADSAIDSLQRAFAARAEPVQRLIAALPTYRKGMIISMTLIVGLLAIGHLLTRAP